jgi:hypothetical protein
MTAAREAQAMERYAVHTGELALVGGIRQERSDLITAVEPASPLSAEARKGRLYLIVEAEEGAPRAAAACQLVARAVRRAFYDDETYSVTSGLRAAIRAANKALYEQNFKLPAHQRAQVGITCAVLRENGLYLAQVQPAQAYALGDGRLRALPAHPSWDPAHVSAAPFTRQGGLGASLFVEPELYRCNVRPGDGALLCSASLAAALGRAEVDALLRAGDPAAATERVAELARAAGVADAHGLVLAIAPARSREARETPRAERERGGRAPGSVGGWLGGLLKAPARRQPPAEERSAPRPDPLHTLPPEQPSATPPSRPAPLDVGESLGERYERNRRERPDTAPLRHENLPPSAFIGEDSYASASGFGGGRRIDLGEPQVADSRPYRPRYEIRPLVDLTWGERLTLPFRRAAVGVEDLLRARKQNRRSAPARPIPRGQGLSYRRTRPPFPWPLLLGLVLAVAVLIFYGLTLTEQNDQELALQYFTAADERLAAVRDAPDEEQALASLDLARQAIDEVRGSPNVTSTNPPLWLRYQELQREYERALAAVQRLTFFDDVEVLAVHPSPTGRFTSVVVPPALTNITDTNVLEGLRYIYAVDGDPERATLYRIPRAGGEPEPYLTPGQTVGTAVVGPVRAALWRIDQVVAVDQAPSGFGYYFRNGGSWNYSKLGASEIWRLRERLDVEEYDGNLYLWGALPDEVLRFNSGFYGDTPDYWLDPSGLAQVDLSTVIDMAVDGGIYLLRANGSVQVLSRGLPVSEVQPEAITPPLTIVRGFFVTGRSPDAGHFYIVDTVNERIIQVEKGSGKVIQQIKVRPDGELQLAELAALFVDDSGARPILYMANGNQLLRAELPAPPRPFREGADATPAPTSSP